MHNIRPLRTASPSGQSSEGHFMTPSSRSEHEHGDHLSPVFHKTGRPRSRSCTPALLVGAKHEKEALSPPELAAGLQAVAETWQQTFHEAVRKVVASLVESNVVVGSNARLAQNLLARGLPDLHGVIPSRMKYRPAEDASHKLSQLLKYHLGTPESTGRSNLGPGEPASIPLRPSLSEKHGAHSASPNSVPKERHMTKTPLPNERKEHGCMRIGDKSVEIENEHTPSPAVIPATHFAAGLSHLVPLSATERVESWQSDQTAQTIRQVVPCLRRSASAPIPTFQHQTGPTQVAGTSGQNLSRQQRAFGASANINHQASRASQGQHGRAGRGGLSRGGAYGRRPPQNFRGTTRPNASPRPKYPCIYHRAEGLDDFPECATRKEYVSQLRRHHARHDFHSCTKCFTAFGFQQELDLHENCAPKCVTDECRNKGGRLVLCDHRGNSQRDIWRALFRTGRPTDPVPDPDSETQTHIPQVDDPVQQRTLWNIAAVPEFDVASRGNLPTTQFDIDLEPAPLTEEEEEEEEEEVISLKAPFEGLIADLERLLQLSENLQTYYDRLDHSSRQAVEFLRGNIGLAARSASQLVHDAENGRGLAEDPSTSRSATNMPARAGQSPLARPGLRRAATSSRQALGNEMDVSFDSENGSSGAMYFNDPSVHTSYGGQPNLPSRTTLPFPNGPHGWSATPNAYSQSFSNSTMHSSMNASFDPSFNYSNSGYPGSSGD